MACKNAIRYKCDPTTSAVPVITRQARVNTAVPASRGLTGDYRVGNICPERLRPNDTKALVPATMQQPRERPRGLNIISIGYL